MEKTKGLKILSCGAGMQSTALALMSCENKKHGIVYCLALSRCLYSHHYGSAYLVVGVKLCIKWFFKK